MGASRARGRPRTFDPETLLDQAVLAFLRHGYDGVSISDLTTTLGCTAPTLYALFESKEGLFRRALERYQKRGFQAVAEGLTQPGSPRELLEQWLRATAARVTRPHAKGCLVLTGGLTTGPLAAEAAAALRAAREAARVGLVAYLTHVRDTGDLPRHADVEGLARFYLAVAQGLSAQATDGATLEQLEPVIALALAAWPGAQE